MKKSAKQVKTVAQEPKKSIVEVVKEDVVEEGFTKIKKMDFELVDAFQTTLAFVFFPEGIDTVDDVTDDTNDRYMALWHIFLATVGWTDNEYWAEYKVRPHHCHDCGSLIENDEHIDEDDALDLKVPGAKPLPPNAKSN